MRATIHDVMNNEWPPQDNTSNSNDNQNLGKILKSLMVFLI